MKRNQLVHMFASLSLILSLGIVCQQESAVAQGAKNTAESPTGANYYVKLPRISPKPSPDINNLSPRISFERTVCDLGSIGLGTKNTCEFRFTNTGQALLKIEKINQKCG